MSSVGCGRVSQESVSAECSGADRCGSRQVRFSLSTAPDGHTFGERGTDGTGRNHSVSTRAAELGGQEGSMLGFAG